MTLLDLGREICCDLCAAERREWLVTNSIGGYASGTVSGVLTRRYHGLLIAALRPAAGLYWGPVGRMLLLTKIDETVVYEARAYPLYVDRWVGGSVEPAGFHHLERFHLEGTTPVWSYVFGDALLEKRVWMQPGANTTYVRYDLRRGGEPVILRAQAIVNCRDHHASTRAGEWEMQVNLEPRGLYLAAGEGGVSFRLHSDRMQVVPQCKWLPGYFLRVENDRGQEPVDDNLAVGVFEGVLAPDERLILVASTEAEPNLDGIAAYAERRAYEEQLLLQARRRHFAPDRPALEHLVLAADQFIVRRALPGDPAPSAECPARGRSVIAGYPWFADWGRDTMISLPGLTLVTGRPEVAAQVLRTFAHYVSDGMLPNRFPDEGQVPEYNTVDATLWYFEALRAYHAEARDEALLRELFPVLEEIVDWHVRGTRYRIRVDPADGLLCAGEPGVQLTWMDAKVEDWVVTPRTGKPVEVNALWYNALRIMAEFARLLGEPPDLFEALAEKARGGFARFWNEGLGYCFDVLDGPEGDDPALRPNQLLAVSLLHSPLGPEQQKAVVDVCARHLLTSHGLRSLAPGHPDYKSHYGGDRRTRDAAYHQGTVWGWLIGPFVSAHLRVYGDPALARSFLRPLIRELSAHGVGSLSEIFDGDPPFTPRGCIAQAWSVAEVLRVWEETAVSHDPM